MELTAQKREIMGKAVKTLRDGGFIPAELYGREFENIHLSVPEKDFHKVFNEAGESTIVNLAVDGEKIPVLINDIFTDPLTNKISHVDFYRVRMDEKTEVPVPLEFVGEAQAVKEKKGILIKAMHEVEVRALPADLPHNIEIDVSGLMEIGESIHIKDIKPMNGVEILAEPDAVIATITEIVEEVVEEKPASVEDVKVEGEEKKAEEEEEKAEEKK
ncbi:MAG: 50S ribosomal protein L25 [Candidatus Paceibacterota bacterium]